MDERSKTLIITAIVLILILAIIFGVIFSVIRIIQGNRNPFQTRSTTPQQTVSPSPETNLPATGRESTPIPTQESNPNFKTYSGQGFSLLYPKDWGLLTCNNSQNIEFDPTQGADQLNLACDIALKPITILVGGSGCQGGETMDKGGVTFIKQKTDVEGGINYRYCIQTNPSLEITHRVSSIGGRAISKEDFSTQIEEMISQVRVGSQI